MICTDSIFQNFFEKFIETAPSNQRQWRTDIQLFIMKEQMNAAAPICPSSTFLQHIKPRAVPLEFVENIHPAQCQGLISNVISPINRMTKEWKNGGLCLNCSLNYKQQDFDSCEIFFDKLIEGVYKENQVAKKIQISGDIFLQSIDQFVKEYNCADAKLPYLLQ